MRGFIYFTRLTPQNKMFLPNSCNKYASATIHKTEARHNAPLQISGASKVNQTPDIT
jgi:hypothetical protein